ncbi:uncharacterized protein [Salvelinus alpinus]|uniref:uncharacterized protein n=1 Tax=Salvelinus alpinus TaxID=8036 RepID=UPI0039FDB8E6
MVVRTAQNITGAKLPAIQDPHSQLRVLISTDKASISHYINQQTFTLTMTDLEPEDSGCYWCAVETNGGSDVRTGWFKLSVTAGTPEHYVDQQEVTGVERGSVNLLSLSRLTTQSKDLSLFRLTTQSKDLSLFRLTTQSKDLSLFRLTTQSKDLSLFRLTTQFKDLRGVLQNSVDQQEVTGVAGSVIVHCYYSDIGRAYRVSVETGGSITIPCRYDLKYKPHVKYLCKVGHWRICSPDPFKSTDKASISDDINKQTITVTMTDLEPVDSGSYGWFVINGGSDVMIERFQLSVTAGTPELYVDQQEVTGVEGGSVIVKCYYSDTGNRKWCRICVRVQCVWENSGTTEGKSVTLHQTTDATRGNILTVTMSGLKMENTGWYRCGVGDLMMPVHITVRQQTTTQSTTTMTTTKAPTTEQSSFSPTAEPVQTDNTVQGPEGGKEKDSMR